MSRKPKPIPFKRWRVNVPVYNTIVWVYYCSLDRLSNELHKRYGISRSELEGPLSYGQALRLSHPEEPTRFIIFYNAEQKLGVDVIAHEVYHTTSNILWQAGIDHTESSEETFSYLHGYLFEKVYTLMTKKAGFKW